MKFDASMKYFHKAQRLLKATDAAGRKWLGRFGGFVRLVARRSLKVADSAEDDMSYVELDRWLSVNEDRKRRGLYPFAMPDKVSEPGKPPLLHDRNSPLKMMLNYKVDMEALDVVIGPERAKSGILEKLEYGEGKLLARPFMGPAQQITIDASEREKWWQDAIVA